MEREESLRVGKFYLTKRAVLGKFTFSGDKILIRPAIEEECDITTN